MLKPKAELAFLHPTDGGVGFAIPARDGRWRCDTPVVTSQYYSTLYNGK